MSYPQDKAVVPPWSTGANANSGTPQQAHWQQQQTQQHYPHHNAAPPPSTTQEQQYAAYYQQYPAQTPEQQAYYQQYYQSYSNPSAPGVEAPPGTSQSTAANPTYNYDYSQYAAYYSQPGYTQTAPAASGENGQWPPPQHHQQHHQQYNQHPYYQQQQQQQPQQYPHHYQRPTPPQSEVNKYSSPTSYQAPPTTNKPPGQKIPPWSKKPVMEHPPPPPPSVSTHTIVKPPAPPAPTPLATTASMPVGGSHTNNIPHEKPSEKAGLAPETWPPSLQRYVEDVFANCVAENRDKAQSQLKQLIMESHESGTLLTTDWSEVDLPSACSNNTNSKKKKKGKKNAVQQQRHNILQKQKNNFTPEEESKRLRRLKRFEEAAAQFKIDNISSPTQPGGFEGSDFNQTVIGTSTKLEKQYLRLTSAPDPVTVRPLPILKQTLELLKDKWKNEQNYTYICDQFKSMRQDLTIQRIKNEFTAQVYEIHARIALEKSDLGEYNQCQTQLKGLYASGIPGHVMEFTAYRILYFIHTQNWADVNSTMAELTTEQKADSSVQHALNVRLSLATANYHRFFILYKSAPNMGGYLIDQFVERERVQSLIILCKACKPDIPLSFIQQELGFDEDDDLRKFLSKQKALELKPSNNELLDTKAASIGLLESVKKYKKVDIKGQV